MSNEPQLIELVTHILELGSDKNHKETIETLIDKFIQCLNPYAFESVFREISKVFVGVKFQSKILGLKMVSQYAIIHPNIIASNLYLVTESLITLASEPKKEIKVAVQDCWNVICSTIENVDIKSIIPVRIHMKLMFYWD